MDIAIPLFEGITALDAIGPYEVLSRLPGARVRFVAVTPGPYRTDNRQLALMADEPLSAVPHPEVLMVPGGFGTRALETPNPLLDWIRAAHETSQWTTSVCTGSMLLAAAGILKGLEATTHWMSLDRLPAYGARPTLKRVVEQGKIITAAGVSSGIDMALTLAARIAAALDARHWDARRGVYVDVVDPATGQQDPRVSQHANGAAILWDVAPRQRWTSIIERITDAQRLTFTAAPPIKPDGDRLDPESGVVLANTFYSHFVYRALCKAGRFDLALRLMRERYGPMLARGASTLWESFEPTASLCHGFSATPVYQLSTEALGVAPARPGFERFRVAPQPADLDWARGIVPTVRGDIEIAWERRDEQIALDVVVPAGCAATVVAPSGLRLRGRADLSPGPHRLSMAP